jgi:hypothetical protein
MRFWAHFFWAVGPKKPGYPLQFLKKPSAFLRDFRFYPLRVCSLGNTVIFAALAAAADGGGLCLCILFAAI